MMLHASFKNFTLRFQMMKHVCRDANSIKRNIKQMVTECNSKTSNLVSYLPKDIFPEPKHEINGNDSDPISIDKPEDSGRVVNGWSNGDVLADSDVDNYTRDFESSDEDDIEIEQVEEYEIVVSDADSDLEEESARIGELDLNIVERDQVESDCSIMDQGQNNDNVVTANIDVPTWFLKKYRSGLLAPNLMNVINFQRLFIPSQSEDYFSSPSHEISLPLLRKIVGIILGPSFNGVVKCHARIRAMEIGVYEIIPEFEVPNFAPLPNLKTVESLDQAARSCALLACVNLPQDIDLNMLPVEWRLYVIALLYWTRNCTSTISCTHIRAVVMCLIQLSVIDRKIGFARCAIDLKEIRKAAKRVLNANITNETESTANAYVEEDESLLSNEKDFVKVEDYLAVISKEDCCRVADSLLQFHETHENLLKNRKRFNTKLVHVFAQLQHCVQSVTMLNAVLNFPFVPCRLHRFFSGTFLYNFYVELHNRKLADGFVTRNLLAKSPSIIALYRYIIASWEALTSIKMIRPKFEVKNKSKKPNNVVKVVEEKEPDEIVDEFRDPNNSFSMLPIE